MIYPVTKSIELTCTFIKSQKSYHFYNEKVGCVIADWHIMSRQEKISIKQKI